MDFPKSYYEEYTSSYCTKIGQDMRGILKYNFNNQGFINNLDYDVNEKDAICFFGSAITSSIGLPWKLSFAHKLSQELTSKKFKAYNFAQGCMFVDNQEIINTIESVKNMGQFKPAVYVVQFIGLDRRFSPQKKAGKLNTDADENVKSFIELFKKLEHMLKDEKWVFFACDEPDHKMPDEIKHHQNCLIWNPPFISTMLRDLPGEKFHKMIGLGLKNKLKKLYNIE
jgi:hypothetical protein